MLILTRRVGEKLFINDNIEVSVLSLKGGQVRLGVTAPEDVQIYREEIYRKIKQEQQQEQDQDQ